MEGITLIDSTKPLIRLVIKEELVLLTGDIISALVLNQFIYWSNKVKDFDKFLVEEATRQKLNDGEEISNLRNGWIYKSAEEMTEELLGIASEKTIQRRMKELVEKGFLAARNNPENNWDRTIQYRVNILLIQKELQELGYALDGYPLFVTESPKGQIDQSKGHADFSKGQIDQSKGHGDLSKGHHDRAISEITAEITTEINKEEDVPAHKIKEMQLMFESWAKEKNLSDTLTSEIGALLTREKCVFDKRLFDFVLDKVMNQYSKAKTGPFPTYFIGALKKERKGALYLHKTDLDRTNKSKGKRKKVPEYIWLQVERDRLEEKEIEKKQLEQEPDFAEVEKIIANLKK